MGKQGIKQNNKKHKDNFKESSEQKKKNKQKSSSKKLNRKTVIDLSKDLRVLQANQRKKNSIIRNANSDHSQRGNNNSAPLLCGIFPLFDFNDTDVIFSLIKRTDPDAKITDVEDVEGFEKLHSHSFVMNSKKFRKNFTFTTCRNFRDRFDYLDLAKVCDWALFILPNDFEELIGDYTEDLLACLIAQGLPSSAFCLLTDLDNKKKLLEKNFETITKLSLGDNRIIQLTNVNEANKLMRHLSTSCKPSYISTSKTTICSRSLMKKKGYFVAENLRYEKEENHVRIRGCMRGYGMELCDTLMMHLTDVGDFPLKEITWFSPEDSNRDARNNVKSWRRNEKETSENQCVYNEDDIEMDDDDSEMEEDDSDMEEEKDDDEEIVEDIGSEDSDDSIDSENANDDKMSFASTAHSGYSMAQIQKFRESRENAMFPDEIEIECTASASEKLRKYRAMKGFKETVWPVDENLPLGYEKILTFKKYQHDRNRVCNKMNSLNRTGLDNFVSCGSKFELILGEFNEELYLKLTAIFHENPRRHLIVSNLFVYEHQTSILHFNERRLSSVDDSAVKELAKCNDNKDTTIALGDDSTTDYNLPANVVLAPKAEPIQSKETMLFQVGFRRFTASPIYSDFVGTSDLTGSQGKGKYCKFMEPKTNVVATVYGPVTFGPVPVLQFRLRQKELGFDETGPPYIGELVANGSLLTVDPTRPIIKRVLLSGQIYKVHKRSVMVRYMFFNTADISRFKDVPLFTKSNRNGHIVKVSGTHGYMKCVFDKPLSQADVVFMALYKRVFPKCNTQHMYNHLPDAQHVDDESADVMDAMDAMF